jgi:indolepyruvate ferredoxin oxidoreductase, beta subunit
MSKRWRILITGVGGQGVLSVGRWLGEAAETGGFSMAVSELHGMSQRGGSVRSEVAIGGMRSPEIADGMADVLIALEPMEAARALSKISRSTTAFVNTRPLLPSSLQSTDRPYPPLSSLLGPIGEGVASLVAVDATSLAERAGSPRSLNVVMLGMLGGSELLSLPSDGILAAIVSDALPAFIEINRKAFHLGAEAGAKVSAT